MGRFSGNPIKSPLYGNEAIPATDPQTTNDIAFTPLIITQFVAQNMQLASGSSNGTIDPASYAKLLALDTQAQTNTRVSQLAEVAMPIFLSAPTDGSFKIYQHAIGVPWQMSIVYLYVSAGSTNITFTRNGVAIAGWTNIPATTTYADFGVSGGSSNYTFNQTDILGLSFSGTTGNCANLYASIAANAQISP